MAKIKGKNEKWKMKKEARNFLYKHIPHAADDSETKRKIMERKKNMNEQSRKWNAIRVADTFYYDR